MEINGIVMVNTLMHQMQVGETRFLPAGAFIISEHEVFIRTNSNVSPLKDKDYIVPIKRIGTGEEDFAIDFFIACYFFKQQLTEEEKNTLKNNPRIIGPYPIETEVYKPFDYRVQSYPRMDIGELMEALVEINQYILDTKQNEVYIEDRKTLRMLIKRKLQDISIDQLQNFEKDFEEIPEEENENGNLINFCADEEILHFIKKRIAEAKNFSTMTIEELEEEKRKAISTADYELAGKIQAIINKK